MGVKKDRRTGNVVKGDDGKPIKEYNDIPIELLRLVPGQKAVGVNDPARMVKALSTPPAKMFETIREGVSHLAGSEIINVNVLPCNVNGYSYWRQRHRRRRARVGDWTIRRV